MSETHLDLDELDRRLLNRIQGGFPLFERPYATLAAELETTEADVLRRVAALKRGRIIRQISAIFDTQALGYRSSLVAARYPAGWLHAGAAIINGHPGVSHNYERDHAFNLWYTIAVPPGADLQAHVAELETLSGASVSRLLPAVRVFKIGVDLDLAGERAADARQGSDGGAPLRLGVTEPPTPDEIALIRELQNDLAVEPEPFAGMAERLGLIVPVLLGRAARLQELGLMRRYAGVLAHRRAGFGINGLVVWCVPDERVEAAGRQMASFRAVSHCYQRRTYADWPYSLFTMIHARTHAEFQTILDAVQTTTGVEDYDILFSVTEFKKERIKYFDPDLATWEREHLAVPAHRA